MRNLLVCLALLCSLSAQAQNAKVIVRGFVLGPTETDSIKRYIPLSYDTVQAKDPQLDSIVADALRSVYADHELRQPDLKLPTEKAYNWKRGALVAGFGLVAGMSYGLNQMSAHHPNDLPSGWNREYWDNSKSWTNKYKNGDPLQGPKFPLSTSALVFTTDGYHMTSTVHKAALLGAGITIGLGEKRPWWMYAGDLVLGFAAYSIGFHGVYSYQMLGR